jgi:hypothetical protein
VSLFSYVLDACMAFVSRRLHLERVMPVFAALLLDRPVLTRKLLFVYRSFVTSMAWTQQAPTMATQTCSWRGSTCTSTRPLAVSRDSQMGY